MRIETSTTVEPKTEAAGGIGSSVALVRTAAPPPPPRPRRRLRLSTPVIALIIFATSFFLGAFRLAETIDINSDEATYAIESAALYQTGFTRWNGQPFFVHPPVFFILEGAYFKLRGLGDTFLFHRLIDQSYHIGSALLQPQDPVTPNDVFNTIVAGRYLSVFYGAIVAALLFYLGRVLVSRRVGLFAAALALIDPYLLRRNHYNMLEPLATVFGLLMILAYARATDQTDPRARRRAMVGAGALMGLALLTKEIALLYVPALVIHALVFRRATLRDLFTMGATALGLYALFPIWASFSGHFDIWWTSKTWLFQRLVGQVHDTGVTRPGKSLTNPAIGTILDYWASFTILGLAGALAAIFLFFYWRYHLRDRAGELLSAWILGCYGFFVAVWRLGGVINEQFFYLVMPLSILTVVYAAFAWPRLRAAALGTGPHRGLLRAVGWPPMARVGQVLLVVLALFWGYDLAHGILRYGLSRDDSYAQVDGYLARTLAPGQGVVGRDALDLYLLPKNPVYVISFLANSSDEFVPLDITERGVPYAILNDQALAERYNGANELFYDWVRANSDLVYRFDGRRWSSYAYRIDYSRVNTGYGLDSLAVNHPAAASSTEDAKLYPAQDAFDAKVTTRWASGGRGEEWLSVDLGARKHISRVELAWEVAYASSYAVQVSDNGRDWQTIYQTTTGEGSLERLSVNADGRYVRVLMTKPGTRFNYSLWEFLVYP